MDTFIIASFLVSSMLFPVYTDTYIAPVEPPKPEIRVYAEQMVNDTFGAGWVYFEQIIDKESGWKVFDEHYPISKKSTAHGLCGLLNGTWKETGYVKTDDPYVQVDACISYVKNRYEVPSKALKFHETHGWF